jgi:hypothetical protein
METKPYSLFPRNPIWSLFIILLLLTGLTACAFYQKYPADWAVVVSIEKNKCPDISGTYKNLGESKQKGDEHKRLDRILIPQSLISDSISVNIHQSNEDTLEISFWKGQKLILKKIYSKENKEFSCSPQGIRIRYKDWFGGEGFELGMEWGWLYLAKSTDGALVVNQRSKVFGVLFFIPVFGSGSTWYRFNQM